MYYFIIGTTAEFIKVAPVIKEFKRRKKKFKLITTGQNDIHFDEFSGYVSGIKVYKKYKEKGQDSSVFLFGLWTLRTFFSLFVFFMKEVSGQRRKDSIVIVHGDTVSSLIGSLVAKLNGVKIAHVESGLRSFDFFEPFPEEISRFVISRFADYHFCPNEWCVNNLKDKKGMMVNTKSNTLYEIYQWARKNKPKSKIVKGKYFVLVVHRQEHVIFGKDEAKDIVAEVFTHVDKKLKCVFLAHDISIEFISSIIQKTGEREIIKQKRLSYPDFMDLLYNSEFVVTDGGSNQEELSYMGKPTLIIRNVTERIEGLGENVLLYEGKKGKIRKFLKDYMKYKKGELKVSFQPSKIIVESL